VAAGTAKFAVLYDGARKSAGKTDRFVEVLPGHMAFRFESLDAYSRFYSFVASLHLRILKPGEDISPSDMRRISRTVSEKFRPVDGSCTTMHLKADFPCIWLHRFSPG
jgi:hypothetical protein